MTEAETRRVRRYQEGLGIDLQRVRMREGRVVHAYTREAGIRT